MIKQDRRELKRIDLDVLIRLLNILPEISPIGITSLQMKTGIKHSACIKYISFLERLGLVRLVIDGRNKYVSITDRGKETVKILTA